VLPWSSFQPKPYLFPQTVTQPSGISATDAVAYTEQQHDISEYITSLSCWIDELCDTVSYSERGGVNKVGHSLCQTCNGQIKLTQQSTCHDKKQNKPVGFYGPIAPPVQHACSSECPQASIAARRRAAGSITISRRVSCCCSNAIAGIAIGANFKMYLLRQFCSNRVEFFYNTQETQKQKMIDQNFWNSNSVIFENFLKFSKTCRAVPLWPTWTIMVTAKLDQSRVLVTKFRKNRLMLKGRSASHTHRLTDKLGWK